MYPPVLAVVNNEPHIICHSVDTLVALLHLNHATCNFEAVGGYCKRWKGSSFIIIHWGQPNS